MIARVVNRLLGAPDGHRRLGGNLFCALQRTGQQRLGRVKHLIDQAISQRPGRAELAPGVGQLFHQCQRNQLGQALQSAHIGHHADVDFLDAEERVKRGIAQAAGAHHIDRAANAAALNGGNHRDAQCLKLGEGGLHVGQQVKNRRAAFGALVVHGNAAAKGLQRHAGAEVFAGAGDDQHARIGGLVDVRQHLVQLAPEGRVHGVERLGPIEHQVGDVVVGREGKTGQ